MSKHDEESNHRTLDEQRRKETLDHYIEEVMKENTSRSFSAAKKLAKKRLAKDSKSNPHYEKVFLRTAPSSRAIPRKGISEIAEIRAMMALPEVAWIKEHLESSGSSRNGEWGLPASVLLKMTYFGRPDFSNTRRHFIPGSAVDWAYGHVKGPATQAGEYFALQTILNRHKPGSAIHVNLRLLKRFVDAKVPGTDRPAYPNAFKRCSVDGTLIQANISQTPTYAPTKRQRKRLERQAAGPRRPMVQGVWHAKGTGAEPSDDPINVSGTRKSCVGYNLVVITCMDTGDPVIWQLMPATGNERTAVVEMLEALYILWPDFPMEYLVGDSLYGNSRDFIAHLYQRYGVHAVFPVHGNMSKRTSDSVDGVPLCQHGPMNLVKTGEVWDSVKRRKEGVKPGHLPPNGKGSRPRLRWECPEDICAGPKTYCTRSDTSTPFSLTEEIVKRQPFGRLCSHVETTPNRCFRR
ncbi:MAG: hypothetical protein IPK93_04650 [Solirubrobacterales bacterium]|nr:hypothetical protein [Solirubrobacterales bacterium]